MADEDVLPELRQYGVTLTTQEAAEVLNCTPLQARRLLEKGSLPGFRIGRQWRVRRADMQDVLLGKWEPESE